MWFFNFNIFYSAVITVVYLKGIFKQESDENRTAQSWLPLENVYSDLIVIISSSERVRKKKISNQSTKDANRNIPQRKKKESNLLQNNEMFWLME